MLEAIIYLRYTYFLILLISILGLVCLDYRFGLALFLHRIATLKTLAIMIGGFLLIDIVGIAKSVFSTNSKYVVGLYIFSPNLPIEEVLFLLLLCYSTLLSYLGVSKILDKTDQPKEIKSQ